MPSPPPRWLLIGCAWALAQSSAHAAENPEPGANGVSAPRREVALAVGHGAIVALDRLTTYASAESAASTSTLTGWNLDVTYRPFRLLELGTLVFSTFGSSNGQGSYAHVFSRWTAEARVFPWRFGIVEPWIGTELGLALADDIAIWEATATERRHTAAVTRPGVAAAIQVGGRLRLGELLALELRTGLLYTRFEDVEGPVQEPDSTPKYAVHPTDYGRRLWFSVSLSAVLIASPE